MRTAAKFRKALLVCASLGALAYVRPALADDAPALVNAAAPADADLHAEVQALKQKVQEQSELIDAQMNSQIDSEVGDLNKGETEQRQSSVNVYGFMDMGLQRYNTDNRLVKGLVASSETTFVSGNSNLYFDARPRPGWRALLETRLSLHPHGNTIVGGLGPAPRTDTSIIDYTSASGRNIIRLGSVIIERAVLEWQMDSRLTIQAGYFLTPWGIWNIDHGTPTLISLLMPSFLLNEAVLRQQTGVNAFGRFTEGNWTFGYFGYISNGRTAGQTDFDDDKAVGGRLTVAHFGAVTTTLGSSFFHGSSEDELRTLRLTSAGLDIDIAPKYSFSETTVGGDLSIDWRGLRVRTEAVARRVEQKAGLYRPVFINPAATEPNRTELYFYGLAAYRWDWFEPLLYGEYINSHKRTDLIDKGYGLSAGVNIYLSQVSQIRLQYVRSTLDSVYGKNVSLDLYTSRYVVSF
ncbi:MAG: hypothetical protein SF187_18785 [Deltaproteobacteria bacterium]|nr:hypothetical protein [Deltaproteobacteria bacterium]